MTCSPTAMRSMLGLSPRRLLKPRPITIGLVYSSMTPSPDPTAQLDSTSPTTEPPPIWFLVPEGSSRSRSLPPRRTPDRAHSFVRELYSRGNKLRGPTAPYFTAIAELMENAGLSDAAMGLFSTSEEERDSAGDAARHDLSDGAAQCSFTLAAIPTDRRDQHRRRCQGILRYPLQRPVQRGRMAGSAMRPSGFVHHLAPVHHG